MLEMLDTHLAATWPPELISRPQWVAWRGEPPVKAGDKLRKVPYNARSGQGLAATNKPDTWATFQELARFLAAHAGQGYGRGFVFTDVDPLVGIDLDGCRDPETGEIEPWAQEIITAIDSYTEASPSRTGIHIIARGKLPPGGRHKGHIEVYETLRYFTFTGEHIVNTPERVCERTEALTAFHHSVWPEPITPAPLPRPTASLPDAELLRRAEAATNGAKFRQLWDGNRSGYTSDSEADLALCSHLIFWTAGDAQHTDRLFRLSGLYRPKWDERHAGDGRTYGVITVAKALSEATQFWNQGGPNLAPLRDNDPRLSKFGGILI